MSSSTILITRDPAFGFAARSVVICESEYASIAKTSEENTPEQHYPQHTQEYHKNLDSFHNLHTSFFILAATGEGQKGFGIMP